MQKQNPRSKNSRYSTPNLGSSPFVSSIGSEMAASPTLARSRDAINLARNRDKHNCVITGRAGVIDVAHIYPFLLKGREEDFGPRKIFWTSLGCFWSEDKITAWEMELFPSGINELGMEQVYNLITLSKDVHNAWSQGAFALKPISLSEDKTTLTVQFFWQKKLAGTPAMVPLSTRPESTEGLDEIEDKYNYGTIWFATDRGGQTVKDKSGDFFDFETDDPVVKPLPSIKLLEMQWLLQRVAGMAGAAGPDELDCGEDSDDNVSNLGLDEVGDISYISTCSGPSLPKTPQFSRKNLISTEGSKYHSEEAESGTRDRTMGSVN
jgi:HNH endonuclease